MVQAAEGIEMVENLAVIVVDVADIEILHTQLGFLAIPCHSASASISVMQHSFSARARSAAVKDRARGQLLTA